MRALAAKLAARYEPLVTMGYAVSEPSPYAMLADRPLPGDATGAAYLCQNFMCLPPVTTPDALVRLLEGRERAFSGPG